MTRLQHIITTGRYTLPVAIFLTLLCWIGVYLYFPDLEVAENTSHPLLQSLQNTIANWASRVLSLVCCFLIGFFLIHLNNDYAIIRRRASVQTSIFLLCVSACPLLHIFYITDIAAILLLFSINNLFKCYQQQHPMGYVFNAFVFLGFASLLFPHCLWFAPIFLIGTGMITPMTFRNLIAAILGCSLPYFFLWGYAYWIENMEVFYQLFNELIAFPKFSVDNLSITQWVVYAYFFVIYVVSAVYCFTNKNKDKIRTRAYLRFIILFLLSFFVYMILQPVHSISIFLLLLTGLSILSAHFFVLTNNKASNWFFIGALVGLVLLFTFNIWMLL
ncbi:hypothetical protein [Bacteroides sp. 519]|uniref:hypothetical protein n=1 Tax=Bacteroides sp. 519 TaxID=2302937 RepID=UPI0013D5BA47|nr:hypothetical protein [Bacteroides sp. 519]NDV60379.1 hypothetical protein [Bacteroides sp. 519]